MTTISLTLPEKDLALFQKYADLHNVSLNEFIQESVIEQIEDEIDLKAFREAKKNFEADPTTYTHEEMGKRLGITT